MMKPLSCVVFADTKQLLLSVQFLGVFYDNHNCRHETKYISYFIVVFLGSFICDLQLCKSYFGSGSKRSLRVEANCCSYDDCNNMTPEEIAFEKIKHKPIVHTVSGKIYMEV